MKRSMLVSAMVAALAAPAAFAADPTPADFKNAAKYCAALRTAKGVETFRTDWGKNGNKKNAYGKCVSATAKAKAKKREADETEDANEATAAAACKKEQTENATKFASDYKNFGQCVKAHKSD